jgi:AbrB family looped-hinge helix DNA binding protein
MENLSTITSKYQVVIPKKVRQIAKIKAGDKVLVQALGDMVVIQSKDHKQSWADALLGLGKEVWQDIDPLTYTREERATWDK